MKQDLEYSFLFCSHSGRDSRGASIFVVRGGLSLGSHRTSLQILADILDVVRSGSKKTRIMYHANLSFRLLDRYLTYALETELVSAPCSDDNCYRLTTRGQEFLEKYIKYSTKSKQLEEQRQFIVKERALLEKNYVARMDNVNSKSYAKQYRSTQT